jgi:hydroxyacyl-ACP dehydratase HTD2-like protein with hotdog domain
MLRIGLLPVPGGGLDVPAAISSSGRSATSSAPAASDGHETDNLLISTLTHNPQPLHLDAEYAAPTEFGRIVVNGTFTFALMVGLSVGDTTLGTLVANLGYDKVRMPKPVFIGDTLRAETK